MLIIFFNFLQLPLLFKFYLHSLRSTLDKIKIKANFKLSDVKLLNYPVTEELLQVIYETIKYMERYNQTYLNEGRLLKSLVTTNLLDEVVNKKDKEIILNLGTTSRDMITHLDSFNYSINNLTNFKIHLAGKNDIENLTKFIKTNFSMEWVDTINESMLKDVGKVYFSVNSDNEIIGFVAFDIYKGKKGYFGPIGVSMKCRVKGVVRELLHHFLVDMKKISYEYVIIGGAGPIEFYEKSCNAVVIPTYKFNAV